MLNTTGGTLGAALALLEYRNGPQRAVTVVGGPSQSQPAAVGYRRNGVAVSVSGGGAEGSLRVVTWNMNRCQNTVARSRAA